MQEINLKELTEKVKAIVTKIGDESLVKQKSSKKVIDKIIKGDYATNIDYENEQELGRRFAELEYKFPIFTEEEHKRPLGGIFWVIDPLDGTKSYYPGIPTWSINVGLYDSAKKEILLGVVYFPACNHLFSAYKDGGAFLNGESISPSSTVDPMEAKIYIEIPNNTSDFLWEKEFQALRRKVYRIRTWGLGSALCYTALGGFDAFFDFSGTTQDYDIFAPMIIAKEAGCKIVEFDIDKEYSTRKIIVTNGVLEYE